VRDIGVFPSDGLGDLVVVTDVAEQFAGEADVTLRIGEMTLDVIQGTSGKDSIFAQPPST